MPPTDEPLSDAPGATAAGPERDRFRVADLFTEFLSPKVILALLCALILLVVGLTGGLKEAVREKADVDVQPGQPGERVDSHPVEVTLKKAFQGDELAPVATKNPKYRYLLVTATLRNTTDHFVDGQGLADALTNFQYVRIDAEGLLAYDRPREAAKAVPEVFRMHDTAPLRALQPGLEQDVVLVWRQDRSQEAPTSLTATVSSLTQRRSSLDGSLGWFDPTPMARVTLPVAPIPKAK